MSDLKTIAQEFVQGMQPRIGMTWMKPQHANIGRPTDEAVFVTDGNFPDDKQVYVHFTTDGDVISVIEALTGSYSRNDLHYNRPVLLKKHDSGLFFIAELDPVQDAIFSEGIERLDDQAPVYLRQLVEIGTLHPIAGSLSVQVSGGLFDSTYVNGLNSADFSTGTVQDTTPANITLPATNGLAKGVLVQLDATIPALEYKQSADFDSVLSLPQAYKAGLLPAPDASRYRLGYVKLTYGSTVFDYDTIWETPELMTKGAAGDVVGPASSTDDAITRFSGTTGKLIQNSNVTINDTGRISIAVDSDSDGLWIKQHSTQTIDTVIITDNDENDQIRFTANGGAIFNEEGNDVDFRIETDTDPSAVYVDGGNNNVGIGTATPDASTKLDIVSTTKGLGLPSMTTAQREAIATPRDGLVVYDTDLDLVYVVAVGAWVAVGGGSHTHTLADITDEGALAALNTVGTSQIDDNAVTTAKILNANVTTAKIADAAITGPKLHPGFIASFPAPPGGLPSPMNNVTTLVYDGDSIDLYEVNLWNLHATGADGITFTDPTTQTWTALNTGVGTFDETNNRRVTCLSDGNGTAQVRGFHTPAPSAPYTITMYTKYWLGDTTQNGISIGWRDGTTGELAAIEFFTGGADTPAFRVTKWTDHDTLSATYIAGATVAKAPHWFRVVDDNTNRIISISDDGIVWSQIHTIGRTDFLTPDQIFFGLFLTTASAYDTSASLLSYAGG